MRAGRDLCLAAVAILPCLVQAQGIYQLSVTDDGRTVYLSTRMRQTGTNQPLTNKMFVVDEFGVHVFGDINTQQWAPSVSGDGAILAIDKPGPPCTPSWPGYRNCYSVPTSQSTITGLRKGPLTVPGEVKLSPNGRFALQKDGAVFSDAGALWDLDARVRIPGGYFTSAVYTAFGHPIANDGTVVSGGFDLLVQRIGQKPFEVRVEGDVLEPAIDAGGTSVVFTSHRQFEFKRIQIADLKDNSVRTLMEGSGDTYQPVISNDGKRVLFLSCASFSESKVVQAPQAYIINSDGTGLRRLTNDPAGVEYAILSGNGQVAIVGSRSGRLKRVQVGTGLTMELIGRTVQFVTNWGGFDGYCVPGSICRVEGLGFAEEPLCAGHPSSLAAYLQLNGNPVAPFDCVAHGALPTSLGDLTVRLNGVPAPILSAHPDVLAFQMPWEAEGDLTLTVEVEGPLAFEPMSKQISTVTNSSFWKLPQPYSNYDDTGPLAIAAHEDFRSLVDPAHPAHPGEIVHLYGTNLGWVTPAVPTGAPSPAAPPSQLVEPMTCKFLKSEAEVLYQGLAPGMTGVYQLDVRVPPIDAGLLFQGIGGSFSCGNSRSNGQAFVAIQK